MKSEFQQGFPEAQWSGQLQLFSWFGVLWSQDAFENLNSNMDKDPAVALGDRRNSGTRREGARGETSVARPNLDFVRFYLVSAALILAVTAVGKIIPDFNRCRESPMLGRFQQNVSNDDILVLACVVEFGILGLICFCRRRRVPCLACSVWGGLCMLVHIISLGAGGMTSCNCLGWFQQIIPLPKEVLSIILLGCAGWLALGGLAALCFSWWRTRPALVLLALAAIYTLAGLWWGIHKSVSTFNSSAVYGRGNGENRVAAE